MCHAHNGWRVAESLEHLAPRFPRLPGVVVRTHAEIWIAPLNRRVDHVARDQGISPGATDQYRIVIDGVARRRKQMHRIVERKIALHDLGALRFNDWQYRVSDPRNPSRIVLLLLRPMRKLAVGHDVFGVGKRGYPTPVLQARIPPNVVDMEMRTHHIIDVARR